MSEQIWSTKINVRSVSTSPIIKLLNIVMAILEFLVGIRRKGTLVEYENKIVANVENYSFWVFKNSQSQLTIAKNRISAVETSTEKFFIIFKATVCTIYASGVSAPTAYAVKTSYKEIKEKAETWIGV